MSGWSSLDTSIMVVGVLAAVACALPGNFMVLRRMSMMGDAISHAVLPGLAGAFLVTVWVQTRADALPEWLAPLVMVNARSGPIMFVGAAIVGVLTAFFTQLVHQYGKVDEGASMGVVFTTLFAIGLIMMVRAADRVDLDPGCVLYGAIELTPLDTVHAFGLEVPRSALVLGTMVVINSIFVLAFYKELKITSFDPVLATTIGIRANVMHYLLMTLIAVTTVAAFEAVGSILVVAMLIVPGATAHLLTDRLPTMIGASIVVAALGAAGGAAVTAPGWFGHVDTNTAGAMAVTTGGLFLLALLFAPRQGVISRLVHRTVLSLGIVAEDALGLLYRLEEHGIRDSRATFVARLREALAVGPVTSRLALAGLGRRGHVERAGGGYRMTAAGRASARRLVRSHRLWEAYLVQQLALRPDHVHGTAMKLEHVTDPDMRRHLAEQAEHPDLDPHGQRIPPDPDA